MARRFPLLLVLLASLPLNADIVVEPAAPTTATPVTVTFSGTAADHCSQPVGKPVITISEGAIEVRYEHMGGGGCVSAAVLWVRRVTIGTLPAGRYTLQAIVPTHHTRTAVVATTEVIVADAGPVLFEPAGAAFDSPGEVYITIPPVPRLHNFFLDGPAKVTFGADAPLVAPVQHLNSAGALVVRPRARSKAEIVDVTLEDTYGNVIVMRNAFTFFDPAAGPDRRVFEPILIPVAFDGPGAHGTEWRTDVGLYQRANFQRNPAIPLVSFNRIHSGPLAGHRVRPDAIGQRPHGLIYHLARSSAPGVNFAVSVRELSRGGLRIRVPVVREADMKTDVALVDIPTSLRFRTKLQVYSLDPIPRMLVAYFPSDDWFADTVPVTQRGSADEPYFAEVDLEPILARIRALDRPPESIVMRLYSSTAGIPKPFWAWVVVTDNETQAVTFITGE